MTSFDQYTADTFQALEQKFPQLDLTALQHKMLLYRRHFHRHPELSLNEYETAQYIRTILTNAGYRPFPVTKTGLCAVLWKGSQYPTLAIRAEMDALPITEATGLPFSSENPGVMHACGHDGILAVALALSELLIRPSHREQLHYNIKFIFQPAEEAGNGTRLMIDAGILEHPHVDEMIIFHYALDPRAGMDVQKRVASATLGKLQLTVTGRSCHWGDYTQGIDAIEAAAQVVSCITDINLHYPLPHPFALGIGTIQGGTGGNIVAESVRMIGTLRTCGPEEYGEIRQVLTDRLQRIQEETGAQICMTLPEHPTPSIINDAMLVQKALKTGAYVFGSQSHLSDELFLSGDNAAYFFQKTRGVFLIFMAPPKNGTCYPFHNPRFDFNEDVFPYALCTLYQYATTPPAC